MKALSIRQPWAWAIFHGKPVENRTWSAKHRGPLLIHAAMKFDMEGYEWLKENQHLLDTPLPYICNFNRGGIVGQVVMTDCTERHESPFFFGPWGFVFEQAQEIDFRPYKGQLGFFDVKG